MKAAGFMDLIEHGVCHLGFYGCIGTFVQLEGARIEAKPASICEQCTAKYRIHFSHCQAIPLPCSSSWHTCQTNDSTRTACAEHALVRLMPCPKAQDRRPKGEQPLQGNISHSTRTLVMSLQVSLLC